MNTDVAKTTDTTRRRVVLCLALLSSRDCQRACAHLMTVEELAFELCRVWFDEVYVPGSRYIDGFKGNSSSAAAEKFWNAFTNEERAALERFHRFFELRLDMRPDEARAREIFPQNDLWESITRDAGHVLEALGVDMNQLEQELSWIVRVTLLEQLQDG